jgi:hypothetical protein
MRIRPGVVHVSFAGVMDGARFLLGVMLLVAAHDSDKKAALEQDSRAVNQRVIIRIDGEAAACSMMTPICDPS